MPKACDACQASSAVVYCRADAAYLCVGCDGKVHGANKLASRHERVWMCEVCEVAPAVVTCKADAASLCVACDTDIHSANPLAQRHERVPVTPLFEASPSSSPSSSPGAFETLPSHTQVGLLKGEEDADTEAVSSWLLPHPPKIPANAIIRGSAAVGEGPRASVLGPFSPAKPLKVQKLETLSDIFSDVDPFLDLDAAAVTGLQPDSLVPVHFPEGSEDTAAVLHSVEPSFTTDASFPLKGENIHPNSYSYGTSTLTHSISCSSLDAAVVPDSSVSDISTPYADSQSSLEFGARLGGQQQQQAGVAVDVVDREARVMRYKEKRQKRKFEKTIRYASRKAYAESRPRVKGRFAKRTDSDVEQVFGSVDSGFGVVPTF